ncbi:hypothetical protein [Pseudomonas sp. S9]|uniref:hypothetical protein n=1 Tax=Pseudomonas sp. S9 TaxID=686578 RepID=UPI001300C320|nr:hypothetical protein [Pseudomonas sp. S9]
MSDTWKIKPLQERITAEFPEKSAKAIPILVSLGRSTQLFRYHIRLAYKAYEDFRPEDDPSGRQYTLHTLGGGDQDAWFNANLQSEANTIACISTVLNTFETFGQLLVALGMAQCRGLLDPYKAQNGLSEGELKDLLGKALKSTEYKYLKAFTNTTKHWQLIVHRPTISFKEGRRGGKIKKFEYKDQSYPACWVEDALAYAIEVQKHLVLCGQALNNLYKVPSI